MVAMMASSKDAANHKVVTDAVHEEGGHICMQILHTGRYGYHQFGQPKCLEISYQLVLPKALSGKEVLSTIDDFVKCAEYVEKLATMVWRLWVARDI